MIYRWAIIDRNGFITAIPEPVNGDSVSVQFSRNMVSHGIITSINTGGLEYYEDAYDLLKTEYDTYGADGRMELKIVYVCDGDEYDFFRGKFDFNTYKRECGDKCFITCDVINQRCSDLFLTRIDQDVDIDATLDMDGNAITPIVSDTVTIEGQAILLQNVGENDGEATDNLNFILLSNDGYFQTPLYLPRQALNEFGIFNANGATPFVTTTGSTNMEFYWTIAGGKPQAFENVGQFLTIWERTADPLNCVEMNAIIDSRMKGTFTLTLTNWDADYTFNWKLLKYDPQTQTFTQIYSNNLAFGTAVNGTTYNIAFDDIISGSPTYEEATYLLFYLEMYFDEVIPPPVGLQRIVTINIDYDAETFFKMELDSQCDTSYAKSYRLDRVYEWLNKPYVGEDCFDVQVTSTQCFNTYHLTNGLHIREVTEPNTPKLFLNWAQLFDGTRKMFNHGWGFTANETSLLVGDIDTFYSSADVIDLGSVRTVQFNTAKDLIYGIIDVGYNKWEAEEYSLLDEPNTARQYRRNVQNSQLILDLMCDIITAGYTIEITRRKNQGKTGTSDWRYDDDLFLINTELSDGTYRAVRGVNSGAANMYSPSTRMNYRLTPARMMLNWFKSVCAARPTWQNDTVEFSSGTGNYVAQGQMVGCSPESQVIAENQGLDKDDILTGQAEPLWETIIASFDAPMTMVQYEALLANPYGRVAFSCGATNYEGWIVTLELRPKDGLADVKLLIAR